MSYMNLLYLGCGYYGTGDINGCKLTIKFHKKHPNHTDEEYEKYMKAVLNEGTRT